MSETLRVDVFVEDMAHEQLLVPLAKRLGTELGRKMWVNVRAARGGHGRAVKEFGLFQRIVLASGHDRPDAVVVGIDGNCVTSAKKKTEIQEAIRSDFASDVVIACPDPHIERWYLADLDAFHDVVGIRPSVPTGKCNRNYYKTLLAKAVRDAGHPRTLGGIRVRR